MIAVELELRKFVAPELVFGVGALHLAGRYAANLGARKVLVVTDDGVVQAGWTEQVIDSLQAEGLAHALFAEVRPNPKDYEVMRGAEVYVAENCNTIVAVGGGSPMDCAKGIGIITANGDHIRRYEGVDRVESPLVPLICVPTTAGSSADVSQFAIITDTRRRMKMVIITKAIVPDVALIDPQTTTTMPRDLTAHTGLDAFCHALEAYVSNASSPVTDTQALKAVSLIVEALPAVVDNLPDVQLRAKMMLGSLFAGLAFSNASLGVVHAMAHSLGGMLDLPHGACNAILLEHAVRYNFPAAVDRYRNIAEAMGTDVSALSDDDAQDALVRMIGGIRVAAGVTIGLGDLGIKREHLRQLASNAVGDPCLVTNPRDATSADIEQIYEQAL